ncbi:4-alpha-glucanotransferase [Adhaeribacter soli]|uniref:4-alpha-glucanotransferase n=1 Tax=Adhaeribacter soli TaxID=2607655 RepID=A0A5N1J7R0_9BACT|nr:4-alpha-glucanotransferase [Adhaeribacter soli]KAA9346143.1 4-alpha-glucanotransferase [Adhaeribacter soli]
MKTARSSGIILHITSLPGPYGLGDLGPEAYNFADFLAEAGFKYWQLLPLNPAEKRTGYSPYSSTSAFAGNTMLISPDLLVKDGYLTRNDVKAKNGFKKSKADFDKGFVYKKGLLRKAYQHFKAESEALNLKEFTQFVRENADWLDDYALFTVLDDLNNNVTWLEWDPKLRDRNAKALTAAIQEHRDELEYVKFCQFLFYRQLAMLKNYCHEKGIYFFGDLPFYVSFDSAEVWANPEYFKLDKEKRPVSVSGVPPDYFSETGQLWGTPIYNWEKLKKVKYDWWIKRLAHNLKLFDVARLDHFRAFFDYWEVPAGEKTAINGAWQDGPADDFFKTLQKKFPDMPFIAEDLGYVSPGVYDLRDRFNLPGMVVLQYGFSEDIATSVFALHNHKPNMIAYTGTHDNNTTKGWFKQEMKPIDRARMEAYLNQKITANNVSQALIKTCLMSVAELAIFPLQDLLNLDERFIMNKPSVGEGNWTWRVTEEQLKSINTREWRELLAMYNRVAY